MLGQLRARTIVQVTRAVRVAVGRSAPDVVAQVTPWRLRRLIDEIVPRAVSRAQAWALQRRMEAEGEPPLEYEFLASEPANGITAIEGDRLESEAVDLRKR